MLFALNYFSGGVIGISYQTIYQADFDPLSFIQVGIGIFSMWLVLAAWRKPKSHGLIEDLPEAPYTARPTVVGAETQASSASERIRTSRPKRKINWFSSQPSSAGNNSRNHSSSAAPPRERISLKRNQQSQRRVSKIRTRRSTLLPDPRSWTPCPCLAECNLKQPVLYLLSPPLFACPCPNVVF